MLVDAVRLSILLSLMGAVANVLYLQYIGRHPSRSPLERRMVFLLWCTTSVLVLRTIYQAAGGEGLHTVVLIPATLVPLAITLFAEGLRRRHSHPVLKFAIAIGTAAAFIMNLVFIDDKRVFFDFFRWFSVLTLAWLSVSLLLRNRRDLSPMENRLVDGITVAGAFSIIFAATDFGLRPRWLPYQLGGLGALMFVYACVRLTNARDRQITVLIDFLRTLVYAALITVTFALALPTAGAAVYVAAFLISLSFILLFTVMTRLRGLRMKRYAGASFFRWLSRVNTKSLDGFIESINALPAGNRPQVLRGAELESYDRDSLAGLFDDDHPIWTRAALQEAIGASEKDRAFGAEQLLDLLEAREATHVAMISRQPLALLLMHLPDLASAQGATTEFALIQKYSRLVPAEEQSGA